MRTSKLIDIDCWENEKDMDFNSKTAIVLLHRIQKMDEGKIIFRQDQLDNSLDYKY